MTNFRQILLLTRLYLAAPTPSGLRIIYRALDGFPQTPAYARHLSLLNRFLFSYSANLQAKRRFKVFTAREYLHRFVRTVPLQGPDSPLHSSGFNYSSAPASSARIVQMEAFKNRRITHA